MNDRIVIKSSPALHAMYVDWLEWAETRAPSGLSPLGFGYSPLLGLCNASRCFVKYLNYALETEMRGQFAAAGLDTCHPFGKDQYNQYSNAYMQHEDPDRLAWVRARIADGIEEDDK